LHLIFYFLNNRKSIYFYGFAIRKRDKRIKNKINENNIYFLEKSFQHWIVSEMLQNAQFKFLLAVNE
jgi:hypothetical protein